MEHSEHPRIFIATSPSCHLHRRHELNPFGQKQAQQIKNIVNPQPDEKWVSLALPCFGAAPTAKIVFSEMPHYERPYLQLCDESGNIRLPESLEEAVFQIQMLFRQSRASHFFCIIGHDSLHLLAERIIAQHDFIPDSALSDVIQSQRRFSVNLLQLNSQGVENFSSRIFQAQETF